MSNLSTQGFTLGYSLAPFQGSGWPAGCGSDESTDRGQNPESRISLEPGTTAGRPAEIPNPKQIQNSKPYSWQTCQHDSPIQSIQDVKGETIGTLSLAAAGTSYAKGVLMSLGIDPENDVDFVAVGTGPSSTALLQRGQIAPLVLSDTILAAMEQVGAEYRYLPETEYAESYFQGGCLSAGII